MYPAGQTKLPPTLEPYWMAVHRAHALPSSLSPRSPDSTSSVPRIARVVAVAAEALAAALITDEQAALQQLDEVLWEDGAHDGAGTKYGKLQMQYQMLMSRFGRETQNLVRFQSEPPFAPSYAPGTAPTWGGAAQGDTAGYARGVPADAAYATWYAENASYWGGHPEGGEYTGAEAGGYYGEAAHALSVRMDPTRPSVACIACKARGELPAELPAARAHAVARGHSQTMGGGRAPSCTLNDHDAADALRLWASCADVSPAAEAHTMAILRALARMRVGPPPNGREPATVGCTRVPTGAGRSADESGMLGPDAFNAAWVLATRGRHFVRWKAYDLRVAESTMAAATAVERASTTVAATRNVKMS